MSLQLKYAVHKYQSSRCKDASKEEGKNVVETKNGLVSKIAKEIILKQRCIADMMKRCVLGDQRKTIPILKLVDMTIHVEDTYVEEELRMPSSKNLDGARWGRGTYKYPNMFVVGP